VLRQIIQEEPTVYDHRLKLARFHDQRHAIDQAESVLREAVQVFPTASKPGWPWPIS
jgi:hypothetical protein